MMTTPKTEAEWLTERLNGIGASESAALFDCHPFESRYSIWHRKVNRIVDDSDAGEMAEWGHRHEPAIAMKFTDVTGISLVDPGDYAMFWSLATPMFATVDRLTEPMRRPVEIKCSWFDRAREFGERLPLHYRVQLQHQMICTGATEGYYAVLLDGFRFRWYREEAHQKFQESLIRRCAEFWRLVETKTPPPIDHREATRHAIAAGYNPTAGAIELPEEFESVDKQLQSITAKIAELSRRRGAIANQLRDHLRMAGGEVGVLPSGDAAYAWRKTKLGNRALKRIKWKGDIDGKGEDLENCWPD